MEDTKKEKETSGFIELMQEVAKLPVEEQQKVALFAQGVVAATAARVANE